MGLDLLPYFENHACLVAHNSRIFKLKLNYAEQPIESQDKASLEEFLSRQEAHNQLEEVLRAVLYILERNRPIVPIQTKNFVVYPKRTPWLLAKKIEFSIDGKALQSYPDCLIFEILCKKMSMRSNKNNNCSTTRRKSLQQSKSPSLIEKGCSHVHIQAQDPLLQTVDHELNSNKIQSVPVLHTPRLGASINAKNLAPQKNKSNMLSNFYKQSIDDCNVSISYAKEKSTSKADLNNSVIETSCNSMKKTDRHIIDLRTAQQSYALLPSNKSTKTQQLFELSPVVVVTDIMKAKNALGLRSVSKAKRGDSPEITKALSRSSSKLHQSRSKKSEGIAFSCSSPVSIGRRDFDHRHKDKQDKETRNRRFVSSTQRKGKTLHGKQMDVPLVQQNATEAVENLVEYQPTKMNTNDVLIGNVENEGEADNVTQAAMISIKKYRHQRTQVLKSKQTVMENDCNDNVVSDNKAGKELQRKPQSPKQIMQGKYLNYFEIQDADMIEVHDNGSTIISPSSRVASQGRKRRNDSPVHSAKNVDGKNIYEMQNRNRHDVSLFSPKKKLYSSETCFDSFRNSDNVEVSRSHLRLQGSNRAFQYYRKKLGEKNKVRRKQQKASDASSDETKSPETRCNPKLKPKVNIKNIVTQYQKVLEVAVNEQPKWGSQKQCGLKDGQKSINTVHPNVKSPADHRKDLNARKSPEHSKNDPIPEPFASNNVTEKVKLNSGSRALIDSEHTSHRQKRQRGLAKRNLSSVSSSPRLRPRKRNLRSRHSATSSTISSPQRRKRYVNVKKVNIPRSASKLKTLNRARNRLLVAKDGVWLLDSGYQQPTMPTTSQSHHVSQLNVKCK